MPKMKPEQYQAQNEIVLKLAARPEFVTINEIIEAVKGSNGEKSISRPRAEKLVKTLGLPVVKRDGRTQYYGPVGATPAPAPAPRAASATKRGQSLEARAAKLTARAEKLTKEHEKLLSEVEALKAEIAAASVITVETPSAETTATADLETSGTSAPAAN
jgi:hypothetical protein